MTPEQIEELRALLNWRETAREHLRDDFPVGAKWRSDWSASNSKLLEAFPALFAQAERLREALERIAGFAPGHGDVAEQIAQIARHGLDPELAQMDARWREAVCAEEGE